MVIAWVSSVAGRRRERTLYSDPGTFTDSSEDYLALWNLLTSQMRKQDPRKGK